MYLYRSKSAEFNVHTMAAYDTLQLAQPVSPAPLSSLFDGLLNRNVAIACEVPHLPIDALVSFWQLSQGEECVSDVLARNSSGDALSCCEVDLSCACVIFECGWS